MPVQNGLKLYNIITIAERMGEQQFPVHQEVRVRHSHWVCYGLCKFVNGLTGKSGTIRGKRYRET